MITEDYVSFEIAKLLKEQGFDEKCFALYNPDGMLIQSGIRLNNTQVGRVEGSYSAPTLQMAMKWLREVHKLEIYPFHDAIQEDNNWWYRVELHTKGCSVTEHESDVIYKTYEEACEAAIKYSLENLI